MHDKINSYETVLREFIAATEMENGREKWYYLAEAAHKAAEALRAAPPRPADMDGRFMVIKVAMYLPTVDKVSVQFENLDIATIDSTWLWGDRPGLPKWWEMWIDKDSPGALHVPSMFQVKRVDYTLHAALREMDNIREVYGDRVVSKDDHGGIGNCDEGTREWCLRNGLDYENEDRFLMADIIDAFRREPRREALVAIRHFVRQQHKEEELAGEPGPVHEITSAEVRWAFSAPLWSGR